MRTVPILGVKDLAAAIDFYGRLGFLARRYRKGDSYAFLNREGFELHLCRSEMPSERPNQGNGIDFHLAPGTAASLQAEFCAAGVPLLSPLALREWKMNEFVVADQDGN